MSERQTQRSGDGARDRVRRRHGGQSKVCLHVSHPSTVDRRTPGHLQEISRLREVTGQLQTEGRGLDKEEELRWRINQLEKDKLELSSKFNQEVSGYEAQLTRCRALLEKSEAQRQTLEYELAVMRRDASSQKSHSEDKMASLITHNQKLEGLSAELHQRASDLQRALEITQKARCDSEQSLQVELRERDHLIHSISTEREQLQEENRHLNTLLLKQKKTLEELKVRMDSVQRDRQRDTEELTVRAAELRKSKEREEKMKKEFEMAIQSVKVLEKKVESERAAQVEFKVSAEVIQLHLRDVEAALSVEKKNHSEAVSSLELLRLKFGEVQRTHTQERERADNTHHTLTVLEQEYRNIKADLIGQLEQEKAESAKLIGQLEQEKAESAKLIGQLEQEKAESDKLNGQLEQEKAESAKLIGQLEQEKAESAKLIGQLEQEKAESSKLIGQLEQEKAESDKLIGQLEQEKAESAKLIGQLEQEKAESAKLTGQLEQEKAESAKLTGQLEQEKAESAKLTGQLEQEKAESSKLSARLQEQEREQMEREQELNLVQKRLVFVEETYDGLFKEIEQLLHLHQGAPPITTTSGDKRSASALMDVLRRVLHHYHTELRDLVKVVDELNKECKDKDELISDQRRHIQEYEARCVCVNEEAERLRVCVKESADAAERAQTELQRITHYWEEERKQHTHTQTYIHTLSQEHEWEQQEKLVYLHTLYQRLLTGCVLIDSPQSVMGSYSWAELSVMIQEQADTLTSDLSTANQRIMCLESVCEGKEVTLTNVCEQLKQREESWIKQRELLDTHHTHLIDELHTRAEDLSRLGCTEERLRVSECSNSALQEEVTRLQELVRVCHRDDESLLAACALLAGSVCALHGRVCVLVHQKRFLQKRVCDAEFLQQEVRTLLHAMGEPGLKGQRRVTGGLWKFRVHVIVVMATLRLRTLYRNTHTLLRSGTGVCVSELRLSNTHTREEESERVMKMLTSSQLCVILHSCMQEVQTEFQRAKRSVCVLAAARSSFTKLMEKLLPESESGCYGDVGSLARQLGHGLNNLYKKHQLPLRYYTNKVMLSALQQHFLMFTQRLHSAEVERRDLRIKLSHIKHRNAHTRSETKDNTHTRSETKDNTHTRSETKDNTHTRSETKDNTHTRSETKDNTHTRSETKDNTHTRSETKDNTHTRSETKDNTHTRSETKDNTHTRSETKDNTHSWCVPVQQFRSVCEELSAALCREQRAQTLLYEQATQLQELSVTMETHTSEELEKDHTLAQAVQSLSVVKEELKKKERSLQWLGKRLSQSQQEKQELQQSINRAENTLRMAARSKECLLSYITSVECSLRELKDRLVLSSSTSSRGDVILHLPTIAQMHQDTQSLELKACQALVLGFTDVYEVACSKVACLEREISSYQSHTCVPQTH